MQEFPKWKFAAGKSRIVENPAEETALGAGWFDSPADVPAASDADEQAEEQAVKVLEDAIARKKARKK